MNTLGLFRRLPLLLLSIGLYPLDAAPPLAFLAGFGLLLLLVFIGLIALIVLVIKKIRKK